MSYIGHSSILVDFQRSCEKLDEKNRMNIEKWLFIGFMPKVCQHSKD